MDVTAIGELLIDFTCQSKDPDGYPTMAAHPGGAPPNFLAALAKFGAKTAMLTKVGNEAFGKMLVNTMERIGVDTSGVVVDDNTFTTLVFVTLDDQGDREFSFSRKPGADTRLSFEELKLSLIDEAKIFHFGTLSLTDEPARDATVRAIAYAKEKGKWITFDPNLRKPLWRSLEEAKEQILWGLHQADVVKISDEEVEFLFGLGVQEGAKYIFDTFGVKLIFVTCGPNGCYYLNQHAQGMVPCISGIQVVDTTGAGDIFGGSAVWKLLQFGVAPEELNDAQLRELVSFACTSASLSTMKHGGVSSVPEYADVIAKM